MNTEDNSTTPEMNFTENQSALLGELRTRYQQDHDLFSGRELSHLRFMRWLREAHPATEDSIVRRRSSMPLEAGSGPVGADSGGTPWCVL